MGFEEYRRGTRGEDHAYPEAKSVELFALVPTGMFTVPYFVSIPSCPCHFILTSAYCSSGSEKAAL